MANTDKINFNIPADEKRDIERLVSSYGKTLSAFMLGVCQQLIKANTDRIKEQALREEEPINFGGNIPDKPKKTKPKKTKPVAQVSDKGGGINEN